MRIPGIRSSVFVSLSLLLAAPHGSAQTRLFDFEHPNLSFGSTVSRLGDVNGDGNEEFLVADPGYSAPTGGYGHGKSIVIGGAGGAWLVEIVGDSLSASGFDLAAAGDVDNDGVPDLIVGTSPSWSTS